MSHDECQTLVSESVTGYCRLEEQLRFPSYLKSQTETELELLGLIPFSFQPKQIRVSTKTGIPLDVLPTRGLTTKQAERMSRINDLDLPRVSTQPRNKGESREERKARKQVVKDERKVRSTHYLNLDI